VVTSVCGKQQRHRLCIQRLGLRRKQAANQLANGSARRLGGAVGNKAQALQPGQQPLFLAGGTGAINAF
jgi:hypothetical protein